MRLPSADEHTDFYGTEMGQRVLEAEIDLLLERLPPAGRVLSVGCGVGVHESGVKALRPALDVTCMDLQREMVERAPRHLPRLVADMTALPARDGAFEAVYLVTALEFVPEPGRALRELARVIRPGGRLVLLVLNPESAWGRARLRELGAPWDSLEELEGMVASSTGGPVETTFALDLEEEGKLREPSDLEHAALLVLVSRKATSKS